MKAKLLSLLLFFIAVQAFGQQDPLLYKYRGMAVDYQQTIKIAEKGLLGAESLVEASKASFMPRFDADGSYQYNGKPMQLGATEESPQGVELSNIYSLGVWVSQPILTGGYLKNTKALAITRTEMAQSHVDLSEQNVLLAADIRYYSLVTKKEYNTLYIKYRDAIGAFLKVIQDRVDEELVGRNELFQAKVRYNDAQYAVIQREKEYKIGLMELNHIIGVPLEELSLHSDTLQIGNWLESDENRVEKALAARPELSMKENEKTMNLFSEKIKASQYNPKLSVGAGGTFGAPSPGLLTEPGTNYHVMANLAIPIFYWGQKRDEVFAKQMITDQSELDYENTVDQVKLEVASSYYELQRSKEQVDFAESALDNAEKNTDVMLDRYREGLSSVLEVLDAQLFWQKSYSNYIGAKLDLNIAYSYYQKATGELSINPN